MSLTSVGTRRAAASATRCCSPVGPARRHRTAAACAARRAALSASCRVTASSSRSAVSRPSATAACDVADSRPRGRWRTGSRRSHWRSPRAASGCAVAHAPSPAMPVASETISPLKPSYFAQQSLVEQPAERRRPVGFDARIRIGRAHERRQRDMRRHHAHRAGRDGGAIEPAEGLPPTRPSTAD